MSQELFVLIEGRLAGRLVRRTGGALRFRYERDYRGTEGATPLSVSMPLSLEEHGQRAIAPWISGLLPDNEQVISRWSREFHVAPNPFSLLSSPIGEDCAGAVQIVPEERVEEIVNRRGETRWLDEAEVAGRLRALRADTTAWLAGPRNGQFSLAGAQAKTALVLAGDRWGEPSGANPTSHILKPAVAGLDEHDLNEHLCLEAARLAGLLVSRTWVERFEDQSAIVVERYDRHRTRASRPLARVHQEDMCQALSIEPSRKYESDGGPGAMRILDLLNAVMSPARAKAAAGRFIDALIWNWLIAGTDAHAKNYSLLLAGDQVRLAPLYDIASALPYDWHERELRLAMRVGRDYHVWPHHDPWPRAAGMWNLRPDTLRERVLELARVAGDAFSQAAGAPAVAALGSGLPARLTDLVADRARRCQTVMGA